MKNCFRASKWPSSSVPSAPYRINLLLAAQESSQNRLRSGGNFYGRSDNSIDGNGRQLDNFQHHRWKLDNGSLYSPRLNPGTDPHHLLLLFRYQCQRERPGAFSQGRDGKKSQADSDGQVSGLQ
ncbi:hypothetical protein CEXT_742561 [Caerostris extrusa]|uniref:Uncharacterized protein n=1 Tax=Caerostris extrusa TaxID=172846 RepID=A0AAV4RUU9_CAEEX|nr:hypothetical protein CEXT_742561 [Caerostris extrusa]